MYAANKSNLDGCSKLCITTRCYWISLSMLVLVMLVDYLRELRERFCQTIDHENALKPMPFNGYGFL